MVELLAPAGSMDALKAAIAGGANAIYVGGSRFNARAYATNFDIEELKEAVQLCHLHNVRLFVTVNTLYKESEIEDLYHYLKDLYEIQVDALIVQDEGIMHLIKDHFKDFEVHASTQCSIHNVDGVKHYQDLGLKRVVVARENTLEEIKEMVKTGCEIEAFVHGALCVSYSGQCFMSQLIGKRSANRGMCAQPCRLPYQLYLDDKKIADTSYLMSCKDLCTIENIDALIDAGVKSFKIEGRMKRPEYVYAITKAYRQAIDHQGKTNIEELKQLFNRDFTKGYLFKENQIVSPIFSGNRGVAVGKVVNYDKKNKKLKIKSQMVIHQGDGIRIGYSDDGKVLNKIYLKGKLVNQVNTNEVFEIDYDTFVKQDTMIYRTTDFSLEKETNKEMQTALIRHQVNISLHGKVGQKAVLSLSDGVFSVTVVSDTVIEKANKDADFDRIQAQLSKLGSTIYVANDIAIDIQKDCFIPITTLNELRRNACEKLDELRRNKKVREINVVQPLNKPSLVLKSMKHTYIHCHSEKQIRSIYPLNDQEVVYLDYCDNFVTIKENYKEIGLAIPTICNTEMFEKCDKIIQQFPNIQVAVSNVGAYERYKQNVTLLLPGMNLSHFYAHNSYQVPAVLSLDMDVNDEKETIKSTNNLLLMTYGYIDAMTTKYCPVSYSCYGKKIEKCNQCLKGKYELSDRMNVKFAMIFDEHCICHILSDKPISRKAMKYQYIRLTIENEKDTEQIIGKYRNI